MPRWQKNKIALIHDLMLDEGGDLACITGWEKEEEVLYLSCVPLGTWSKNRVGRRVGEEVWRWSTSIPSTFPDSLSPWEMVLRACIVCWAAGVGDCGGKLSGHSCQSCQSSGVAAYDKTGGVEPRE